MATQGIILPTVTTIDLQVPPDRRGCYGWVERYFPRIEGVLLQYKGSENGKLLSLIATRKSPQVLRMVARHRGSLDEGSLKSLLWQAILASEDSWNRSLR